MKRRTINKNPSWRLTQTPYKLRFYGSTATHSRHATMGIARSIYFITICITPRCNALANGAAWQTVCETVNRLDKWNTYCIMTMPDHIHLLTAPLDRELSVAAFLKWFKRWFNESYGGCEKWRWQPGGFDRLLRTSESIHEKWNYIRENPVRAGLVTHWKQWPYQKGFADDE